MPKVHRTYTALLALLLAFAIGHTLWSTSLDSFTIDEPYHITAGATYLRRGDFRINPEHPPLVKLIAALALPPRVLYVAPFKKIYDKPQERTYTQRAVFLDSNYPQVHRHARFALIAYNTLLMLVLTLLLRRIFGPAVSLWCLLLLALDPTVSAHMPVVMTDLPMALTGTICCALTWLALTGRRWRDWLALGAACGVLLGTKHSAPLIVLPLLCGCIVVLLMQAVRRLRADALPQLGRLAVAALLCVAVLWSLYGFRYDESRERDAHGQYVETFNRPLDAKIGDMRTPLLRNALHAATAAHLLPRAYLWGLADTLHVGVEGRPTMVRAFGHDYIDKAPAWVALAFLLVKVPLPFLALALAGIALLALRLLPRMTALPLTVFVAMLIFFMAFIAKNGVFYAGVRHWLFAIPLLAVPAAVCLAWCVSQRQRWLHAVPAVALLLIAVPVLPQRRIWEYHNVLAGGSYNAWKNFDNESVDLGQRSDELMTYFQQHISPAEPFWAYWSLRQQETLAGLHPWRPTPEQVADGHLTGWFVFRMSGLADRNWQNIEVFRDVQPTSRIGNAAIYRGTFYLPKVAGGILIGEGMHELDVQNGDMVKAELYLKRGVAMNPETPNALIELGNFALRRKDKPEALRLYRAAVVAEKDSAQVRQLIAEHIALVEQHAVGEVAAMRRPSLE